MKTIVDEAGEIIAKATDDHILIGGHHRLAVAASLGKRLFWRDTGEPVKLDLFFKQYGSSLRHTACAVCGVENDRSGELTGLSDAARECAPSSGLPDALLRRHACADG